MSQSESGGAFVALLSDRLKVEIAVPGTNYRRTRFDWTGWVQQVTLDRTATFCVDESLEPGKGTGGGGLCNEYGNAEPIGYADCELGEQFPKLGVGLLTKQVEGRYDFFRGYELDPFETSYELSDDGCSIVFRTAPKPCRGYAAELIKTLTARGNKLNIAYELRNVGEKPIETSEYNHNFVRINGAEIGPDYELTLPFRSAFAPLDHPILVQNEHTLNWRRTPEPGESFYAEARTFEPAVIENPSWTLLHKPSGAGMRETLDRPLLRLAVWGQTHVASAEMFVQLSAAPGETLRWNRTYEFFRE
ncbi:hypothetical protein [Cohnella yongneupensis]|uniref:Uncharacterized protein n=1 Tax=Cohnella yongneupensis TaxID=425006 RepID=A0ABW0R3A0_9BACL